MIPERQNSSGGGMLVSFYAARVIDGDIFYVEVIS